MGTFGQGPGCGTSPSLGELSLELSGGTWLVTRKMNQSRTGELNLGLTEGHSLGEWRCLVSYQVFDLGSNYAAYG